MRAQNQDSVNADKWLIGIAISPDYCYRILSVPLDQKNVEHGARYLTPKLGYTTGIGLSYRLSKKCRLETGIFYTNKGTLSEVNIVYSGFDPDYLMTLEDYTRYFRTYSYLEVPVKLNVHFKPHQKIHPYLSLGVAPELLLGAKDRIVVVYNDDRRKVLRKGFSTTNCYSVNLSLCIGYGWSITVNRQLSCIVEPSYTQFLIQQIKEQSITHYLYSLGLRVGVYYRLKSKMS